MTDQPNVPALSESDLASESVRGDAINDLVAVLVEVEALLQFASLAPWRGASAPNLTSREDMLAMLREKWICGPDSVDNEFFHVLADEGAEEVSVCIVGNGPKRRDNTRVIVGMRNAMPYILRGVQALLADRREVSQQLAEAKRDMRALARTELQRLRASVPLPLGGDRVDDYVRKRCAWLAANGDEATGAPNHG